MGVMQAHGRLIAIEGGDGAGKDANIDYLREVFAGRDDVVFTREPGGTAIGERVRAILTDPTHAGMAVETELLLFLACRAQLIEDVIRPALREGKTVISNRFALSTIAYQIFRKERMEYLSFLESVSATLLKEVVPFYVLLDVPPEVGHERVRSRGTTLSRFDAESLVIHTRVRDGYVSAVKGFPHAVVDATKPLDEVRREVERIVRAHMMS